MGTPTRPFPYIYHGHTPPAEGPVAVCMCRVYAAVVTVDLFGLRLEFCRSCLERIRPTLKEAFKEMIADPNRPRPPRPIR